MQAETYRTATFAAPLSRDGPGLLLRDIEKGADPQIAATIDVITQVSPDILVLTDFDYDMDGLALAAFASVFSPPFPYTFALQPNAGLATGLDLDRNGKRGDARDAQGYGRFAGDGGMAILSRFPIATDDVQDLSLILWKDLPGATLPRKDGVPFMSADVQAVQRLSSNGHWIVPIVLPDGSLMQLMAFSATPPVFDGPEDRNGLRNRDELRLWELVLADQLGSAPRDFVVIGNANLDPQRGDGYSDAMADFLANPMLQDPLPNLNTANWDEDGPGDLRVSYVLPDSNWRVADAGVYWPTGDDPSVDLGADLADPAGPHHLVWVDIGR